MAEALSELAHSISQEPGFILKIWKKNEHTKEAGGIYLFGNEEAASGYLEKHTALDVINITAKLFAVNTDLSNITRGPIA